MAYSAAEINRIFDLLNLARPDATRLERLRNDPRSISEMRDALIWSIANSQGISFQQAVEGVLRQHFESRGLTVAADGETDAERLSRIYNEVFVQKTRTLGDVVGVLDSFAAPGQPADPSVPPAPPPTQPPQPPLPTPAPVTPEPVDFHARARALFPWLPTALIDQFVDDPDFGWAATGDASIALAGVRASDEYEQFFPGIKRDDGSLRMTEAEWFSTREAYSRLFQDFGLNAQIFADRFTELMEGEVSPSELAGRLGGAYEMIHNNIPEVASEFAEFYGVEGEAALFASFIDPDIGQAILDHRISVAQVAGQGLARGFDVDQGFAERLVAGGVDQGVAQNVARNLFIQAEGQLQTLDDLVKRHRDPDDTFSLEEFAEANVFGSAEQTRRIRRVLRAEAALFTGREIGQTAVSEDFALTGLSPR